MQFKPRKEQTDNERLEDMVTAAMETGNPARARELLAEHADTFPLEVKQIRGEVLRTYGTYL